MTIRFTCEHCARPVHQARGGLRLYDDELTTAEAASLAHQAAQTAAETILDPLAFALTVDDLLRPPPPAKWHIEHHRCASTTGRAYEITTDRITTVADALDWTIHLMDKPWIGHTDWSDFIHQHVVKPMGRPA